MNCYLCSSTDFSTRKGQVRDDPKLTIIECRSCGLVMLSSQDHILPGFYENSGGTGVHMQLSEDSGMYKESIQSMEFWLKETAADDRRRFKMLDSMIPGKKMLDFGCGNGGFLLLAETLASKVIGVELEKRVLEHWQGRLKLVTSLEKAGGGYDLITAFHVIEHITDPKSVLMELASCLAPGGRLVVEVPNSEDVLLTLYDSEDFQRFTYWSQHLFLFNADTLGKLARQAGLRVVAVQQSQRFPLSNHLYWLSQGKPGGHQKWSFLDTLILNEAYSNALAKMGKCDTIIGYFEKLS